MFDLGDVIEFALELLGHVIEGAAGSKRGTGKPDPKPKQARPKKKEARQPDEEPWERKEILPPWEK